MTGTVIVLLIAFVGYPLFGWWISREAKDAGDDGRSDFLEHLDRLADDAAREDPVPLESMPDRWRRAREREAE